MLPPGSPAVRMLSVTHSLFKSEVFFHSSIMLERLQLGIQAPLVKLDRQERSRVLEPNISQSARWAVSILLAC